MHDNPTMVAVMIRMPDEMRDKLAAIAAKRGETTSVVIREALREYLDRVQPPAEPRED
jgi:predicted transcriptional regulator